LGHSARKFVDGIGPIRTFFLSPTPKLS
jgi:hypothetical protein